MQFFPSVAWGKKATAAIVAGAFLFTTVGEPLAQTNFWSDRQAARTRSSSSSNNGTSLSLLATVSWPKESLNPVLGAYRLSTGVGTVVETHTAPDNGLTVIHFQDAHGHYGAQYNASKILDGLYQAGWSGGDGLSVYQEGGVGPAHIEWLSAFPDDEIKEQIGRAHLRHGDITGEEYRALVASSGTFRLVGVETESLLKKNLAARHETAAARAAADVDIDRIQHRLTALKDRLYPPSLLGLDRPFQDYTAQKINFVDYIQSLSAVDPRALSSADYPNLYTLLRLTTLEKELNFQELSAERDYLVRKMVGLVKEEEIKSLVEKAADVRDGRLKQAEFYETLVAIADKLKRQGYDLPTRSLRSYGSYLKLADSLRHGELLTEADQLRERLLERYSGSDRLWRLIKTDRRVALERLLWKQEMTPDQYAAFKVDGPLDWADVDVYVRALERELGLGNPPVLPNNDIQGSFGWAKSLPQVRSFYELAVERDMALVQNTLDGMKGQGTRRGVLIAGGFHTPGLTRLFRQHNVSYAVIQPNFDPAESGPGPKDVLISQVPPQLTKSVRELNRLVSVKAPILPGAGDTSQAVSLKMVALAAISALSMPKEKGKDYLGRVKVWMKQSVSQSDFSITSVFEVGKNADERMFVVFGRFANGESAAFFLREKGENGVPAISYRVGTEDLNLTETLDLSGKLDGFVVSPGLSGWVRSTLTKLKNAVTPQDLEEVQAEATRSLQALSAGASRLLVDLTETGNEKYFLSASKDGAIQVEKLKEAVSFSAVKTTKQTKSFLQRYFSPLKVGLAALLGLFFGTAHAAEGGALLLGAVSGVSFPVLPVIAGFAVVAVTLGTLIGFPSLRPVALGNRIAASWAAFQATETKKSVLPMVAGLSVGAVVFLWGIPAVIGLSMALLPAAVVSLLSPAFLILDVMSGVSFLMVALVFGYKVYSDPEYKDARFAQLARVAVPAVAVVFTSGVLAAAFVGLAAWGFFSSDFAKTNKFLQPIATRLSATVGKMASTSETLKQNIGARAPPTNLFVRAILRVPGIISHVSKDLAGTFKSFAFQSALDLHAIYTNSSVKTENELTSAERGLKKTLSYLRGTTQEGSLRYGLAQSMGMVALVYFYTQHTIVKRMSLLVLSSVAGYVGTQGVGVFVWLTFMGNGAGAVVMAGFFFWQAYRFYQKFKQDKINVRVVLFASFGIAALAIGVSAFMGMDAVGVLGNFYSFNPAQWVGVDPHALAQIAQVDPTNHLAQIKHSFVQFLSPSTWVGSTMLGLLMVVKGSAQRLLLTEAQRKNETLNTSRRLFGWIKYAIPVAWGMWKESDQTKRRGYLSQIKSSVTGLQLVGPEIALVVGAAAWAGSLNIGLAPVAQVIDRIENTQQVSIMGLSNQLTESVSVSLFGEAGRLNFHDYKVIGTGYSAHELTLLSRGELLGNRADSTVADREKPKAFKGLFPMLLEAIIPSARSEEAEPVVAGPPPPLVGEPPEIEKGPHTIHIDRALGLKGVTTEERVSRIRAANAREFVREHLAKYLTGDLVLAGGLVRDQKNIPSSMSEVLRLLNQSPGGTSAYLLEGTEKTSGKSSKNVVETQINLIINATIYDDDAKGTKMVRTHAARMRELMVLIEEGVTTPRLIIDYFADIKEAETKIAVVKKEQAELQQKREELESSIKRKEKLPGENIDRALKTVKARQDELNRDMDRLVGQRQDAIRKLKDKMPALWPDGTTLEEALKSRFDFDETRIDAYVKEKLKAVLAANKEWADSLGINDADASSLRVMLTKEKVAMLKAAIPAGENTRAAMEIAVDLLKLVASKASGGIGLALGAVVSQTISDPVQNSLKNAGVWAYAQAVVELEEIQQQEKVVGKISKGFRDTHGLLVQMDVESLASVRRHLDTIRDRTAAGTLALRDYLTARKSESESSLANESRKRDEQRWISDAAKYEKSLGGTVLRLPESKSIELIKAEANRGRGLFGQPDEQLKKSFDRLGEQDQKALASVQLGPNPSFEPLAEMMMGRSYALRQGRYLSAQREAEMEAVANTGKLKWFGSLGFFTSGAKGKELRNNAALQASISVSATFDPAEALRMKEYELQVDAADLNTSELTNRSMNELGNQLQALEHLYAKQANLVQSIQKMDEIIRLNERAERVHNMDRALRNAQDEKALAQYKADLLETNNLISAAKDQINAKAGKTTADEFDFDGKFKFRSIQKSVPYFRFRDYIDRTRDGEKTMDRMNANGVDFLATTEKEIQSSRQLLAKMKEQALALPPRPDGSPPSVDVTIVQVLEGQLNEFERVLARAQRNADQAPQEVYKDLNELSERALALLLFKASLSPEIKWKTADGMRFDTMVNAWDKGFRGRFDIFASQRIAIKNAEVFQARAAIASKTEPITLNLDVFSVFFGRSGLSYSVAGGSNIYNILSTAIPQKAKEDLFRGLYPLADAARASSSEGFGAFLANIIPGYQSSAIREKTIATMLWQAQKELTIAEQKEYDVQSNRESFIRQYQLAVSIRDDIANLHKMRQERVRDDTPLLETRYSELSGDLEDLQTTRDLQEATNRLHGLEIALINLGLNPKDLPPFSETPERSYKAGVSLGGKVASETFEAIQMRIGIHVAKLELEQTIMAQGMPRMETRLHISRGADGKVALGATLGLWDPNRAVLPADLLARIAAVERAEFVYQQTLRDQASRVQDDWKSFVLADAFLRLAEDIFSVSSERMKVLAKAKMTGSEEYNSLNRVIAGLLILKDQGGAGLRDATYRLHIALGLTPPDLPHLNREEAQANLIKAAGRKLGDFSSNMNISIHDPAQVVVLRALSERLPVSEGFGDLWKPILSTTPTDPLQVPNVPEVPELKMRKAELAAEKMRNILPKVDVTAFLQPLDGRIAELAASWQVWGGGGKSREKIIEGEIAISQERLTEKTRSHFNTINGNRAEIKQKLERLNAINQRIEDLKGEARSIHKDYIGDKIQLGQLASLQNQVIQLTTERADVYMTIALKYQVNRDLLSAYGMEIPLLEDALDKMGLPRIPTSQRAMFDEQKSELLAEQVVAPVRVAETSEWNQSLYRQPGALYKPADGRMEQNPLHMVSRVTDVFGEKVDVPLRHLDFKGPDWFKKEAGALAQDVGMKLADDRLLNESDWAAFLDHVLKAYRIPATPETLSRLRTVWARVNAEYKDLTDASEMPNSFSKYTEFAFKEMFPRHGALTADLETSMRMDKNFHKKLALAIYYAAEIPLAPEPDWFEKIFAKDAAALRLMDKERKNQVRLSPAEKVQLLEWQKNHNAAMDRSYFVTRFDLKERESLNRAAQAGVAKIFPELARWSERLKTEKAEEEKIRKEGGLRVDGVLARYGDLDLESLYASLTAMAISNGWNAETLSKFLEFQASVITPQVGRYAKGATLQEYAQQPDADRLRFLLQGYQERKAEAGSKGLKPEEAAIFKDVIDAEKAKEEAKYLIATSFNFTNEFVIATGKTTDQALKDPGFRQKVVTYFPTLMDRLVELKNMPEAERLILHELLPSSKKVFWLSSEAQGVITALMIGWLESENQAKTDGALYGAKDVRAHVRNTLMILENSTVYRAGQNFFRGLGWPVPNTDGPREKILFASRLASLMESYVGRPLHSVPGDWATPEFTADQVVAIIERLGRADGKIDQIKSEGDLTYLLQMADEARRKFGDKFAPLYDHQHRNSKDRSPAPELTDSYFLESRRNIPLYYDAAVADLFYGLTGVSIQEAAKIDWDRFVRELPSKNLGQPLAPWETPEQRVRMARFLVEGFDVRINPRDSSKTVRQEALKDQRIPFSIAESLAFDTLPKMGLTPEEWKDRLQRGLLWQVQTMALSQDRWGSPVTMLGQGDLEGLITRAEQVGETDDKVQQLIWVQAEIRRRYEEMNQQLIAKGKPPLPALDETTVTGLASWVIGPLGKEKTDQVMGRLKDLSEFSTLTWLLSTLSNMFDWTKTDDRFMIYRLARAYDKNKSRPAVAWYLDVFFADATRVQEKIHELKTVSSEGYVPPFTLSMYLTLAQEKQAYMHWFNRVKGYEDKLAKERTNDPLFGELVDAAGKDKVEYRLSFLIGANIEHRILDKAGIKEKAGKLVETRERAVKLFGMEKGLITGFLVELSSRMDSWARGADRDFRDADDSFAPTEKFKEFLAATGEKVTPFVERALADIPNRFARFEAKAARDKQAQQLNMDPQLQEEREARRPGLIKTGANAFAVEMVKVAQSRGIFLGKDFAEMSLVYQESVAKGYSVADAVELASLQIAAENRFRKAFDLGDKPLTTIQKGIIAGLSNAVFERWGSLTRTGSESDLARYKEEVVKDQRDMDLVLRTAELLDRRINRGLFAKNPNGQIQLRRIMVMASIALERGVVFYESENKPNFTYINDLFNSYSVLQKNAVDSGLWPSDSKKSGRLAQSLLLRLDRAMDVGLWDPLEDPIRSREDYGDAVHAAFESFRAGLGDVKRDPKGAERYANSRFSPEDLARLEKKVADTLFERQLPPAHVAILMERAKHMGEEIKKAAAYADENLFNDPEIALIGRAIQQPDPVTLLVLADKSYPDSVFSLDLADVLSDLLGKDGVKSERSSQKAIEMMNHASDQWAKTLRTAMLQGLREYLPKNRNVTKGPVDSSSPTTPPGRTPPTDPTKGPSLEQKTGAFSVSNIPLLVGFIGLFSGNKKWAKWGIPIILLGLLINPAMALAATLVDPTLYAGVIAGISGTLSGAATFSTTMTEMIVGNSGAISATLFAAVTAYAIYIGMKDTVRNLFQKSKAKAVQVPNQVSPSKRPMKEFLGPVLFGALTLAAIFMIMVFANTFFVNLDLLEQLKSLFNSYFALGAVQTPPLLGVERIAPSQWFEWSPLAGMTEWFGSGLFVGWLVSFGISIVVGLLKGIWDRINYSKETHIGKSNPSIGGGVTHPKPDLINRGWAVASFWLMFPIFAAAAFGATAAISGAVSNLVLLALGLSGVVAIVNGILDYLRRDKTRNEIKGPDQPWLFLTFRIFMFYVNSLTFFVVLCSLAAGDLTGFSALTATGVVLLEAYLITGSHLKFVAWLWAIQDWVLAFLFGDSSLKNNRLANPPKLATVKIDENGQGNAVADHVVLFENPTSPAGEAKQREILAGIRAKMIENPSMVVVVRIVNQGVGEQYAARMEKYGQIIYDELFIHPDFNENNGAYIEVKDGDKTLEKVCRVIVPVREGGRLDKPWSYMLDMAAESALGSIWVDSEGKLYFGTNPSDSEGFPKFEGITVLDGPTVGDVKDKKTAEGKKLQGNDWQAFEKRYRGDVPWPITSSFLVPGQDGLEYSKQGIFDKGVSWFYGVDSTIAKPQDGSYKELSSSRSRTGNKSVVAYRMVNDIDIRQPTGELSTIVYEAEMDPEHVIFQPNVMNRGLESLRAVAESDAQFMLKHMQVLTGPLLLGDGRAGGKFLIAQEKYTDLMLAPKEAKDMELGAYLGLALRGSKPVRSSADVDDSGKRYGNEWVVYAQTVMELSRPTILLGLSLVLGLVTGNFALGILFPVIYYFGILPQLIKFVPKSAKRLTGMPKLFASHDEAEGIVVPIRILVHSVTLDISRIADADDKALYYKWRAFFDHFTEWARMTGKVFFPVPARFFNNLVIRGNVGAALWLTVLALRLFATWSAGSYGVMLPLPALMLYGYLMFILLQDKITGAWLQHLWILLRAGTTQAGEDPGEGVKSQRGRGLVAGIVGLSALTAAFVVMGLLQGVWAGAIIAGIATAIFALQKFFSMAGSDFAKKGWFVSRGPTVGAYAWLGAWVVLGMLNWAWAVTAFVFAYVVYSFVAAVLPRIYEISGRKIHTDLDNVASRSDGKTPTTRYDEFLRTRPWNLNTLAVSALTPFTLMDYILNGVYEFGYTAVTLLSNLIHDFRYTRFGFHAVKNLLIKRIAPLWNNQPVDKLSLSVLDYFGFFRMPIITFLVFWAFASMNGALVSMGMPFLALSPTAFFILGTVAAMIFIKQYQFTTEPVFKEYKDKPGMSEDPYPEFSRYVGWGVVTLFVLLFFSPVIGEVIPSPAILFGSTLIIAMGISALVNWFGGRVWPKFLQDRAITVTQLMGLVLLIMVGSYYVFIEPVGPFVSVMETLLGAGWLPEFAYSDNIKDIFHQVPLFGIGAKRAMIPAFFSIDTLSSVLQAFPLIGIVHVFTAAGFLLFGTLGVAAGLKSLGWDSVTLLRSSYPKSLSEYNSAVANFNKVKSHSNSEPAQIENAKNQMLIKKRNAYRNVERVVFESSLVVLVVGVIFNPWIVAATVLFLVARGLVEWNRMKNNVKGPSPWPLRILGLMVFLGLLVYAGSSIAAPVIAGGSDPLSIWTMVGNGLSVVIPLVLGHRLFVGVRRGPLELTAKSYFDLLNKGEELKAENPPRAILLLGNPFLQSVTDLAVKWKDGFQNVPIVLAGGIGAGTPGLLAAVKKQYAIEDQGIADFLNQQSPALYSTRDFKTNPMTEADLMRFTLMKSGVPSNMIHQETVPSSTLDENFQNTQEILRGLAGDGRVGVITGAPMRLRFGAVASNMKTKLDLSYEPVVMNVGPQNLASMSDNELVDLVQVRAGNNGGEVAWWANALGRELTQEENELKVRLEKARSAALDQLKKFNSWRAQDTRWGQAFKVLNRISDFGVKVGNIAVGVATSISEKIFIKSWIKPVLVGALIAAALFVGSALAAPVAGNGAVVAAGTTTASGTSLAVSRLSTVALPAIFGLGVAAVAMKGGKSTSLVSPLRVLSDSINSILQWGALLDVPTLGGKSIPKGHALFVDLRAGTQIDSLGNVNVDPAVGALFLSQVRSLSQHLTTADSPRAVRVELVVSPDNYVSLEKTSPSKAFQALLSQAGISKSLADQIDFEILVEGQVAQKLSDLAPTMHLNVVAPAGDGLAFWQEVGKQANVSLAILLAQLLSDVDVTFTGEAAKEMARRAGQEVNEDGTFTLKGALSPIEALARDQQKLLLLNIQA